MTFQVTDLCTDRDRNRYSTARVGRDPLTLRYNGVLNLNIHLVVESIKLRDRLKNSRCKQIQLCSNFTQFMKYGELTCTLIEFYEV
jgi:hypothetical protein